MRPRLICSIVGACAVLLACAGAQAAPKNGDRFGDWIFTCEALGQASTVCALTQELSLKNQAKRLLRVTLGPIGPGGQNVLLVLAPLGVSIPAGVAIKIDNGPQSAMQLQSCTAQGCSATLPVDEDLLWALKAGNLLRVGFKAGGGSKTLSVPVSLQGVQDGLAALAGE